MLNRDRVRALVAVAKNSPTSSAVHVDTIMGGRKKRRKHKKPILQDVELDKAKFSSRSEAGRYAANMRWKGKGSKTSGAGTASDHQGGFAAGKKYERERGPFRADPPSREPLKDTSSLTGEYDGLSAGNMGRAYEAKTKPEKESSTLRNFRNISIQDNDTTLDKGFGKKNFSTIGAYLRGEKYEWQKGKEMNPNAKDATAEDIEFGQKSIAEIKAIRNPLFEQADKAIGDLDNGRADAETTVKTLRSIKRKFTSAAKATREAAKKAGQFPTELSQNTVRSMIYTTKAGIFDNYGGKIDAAIGDIVSEMRGKGSRAIYDVGKSKKQVRKDLDKWFKEKWVDISRPKEGGGFEPCGRNDASSGKYPKCVPASKAAKMSAEEIASAVRRKRKAESTETRVGKKPINVPTEVEKASKNVPVNSELYARVKAEAKQKFDVYPSAYANAWLVREYKKRGGKYRIEKADSPAWQTKEGKNPKGGLNAKGRASYKRETGGTLRPPVKRGDNPRRASFLARMGNMPGPERDANGEPTRLLLSLQAWGASSKADARMKAKAISARNKPEK